MRLSTFESAGQIRPGASLKDQIVDLSGAFGTGDGAITDLLAAGADGLARAQAAIDAAELLIPQAEVTLHPPVRPRKFFAIGLNYADHIAESGLQAPENLTVFVKAPTSVTGPYDPIELPAVSTWLDYEGELGIVIGRRCRHVRAQEAASVIGGYVIVNDVSVRDWQMMGPQWSLGKSFDTHGPLGPCVVTPDEVGDPHALELRTYVNGNLRQHSNTSNLVFDCFKIVEILSQACTLEPGDVIATGTPSGVAGAMDGQPWLAEGDRVRIEIDRLGAIENRVVVEPVPKDFVVDPSWLGGRSRISA